jgi:hypothetical protein
MTTEIAAHGRDETAASGKVPVLKKQMPDLA